MTQRVKGAIKRLAQRRLKYIARQKAARAESITPMALGPAHFHPLEAQNKPH